MVARAKRFISGRQQQETLSLSFDIFNETLNQIILITMLQIYTMPAYARETKAL